MKKTKVVLAMVCAVLLVAASVMGTLAYLTSTATVTNTFTVGNVKLGNDTEAGLDEAKVDKNGKPLKLVKGENGQPDSYVEVSDVNNATRVTANTYKLQPGHEYTKDPTIHVDESSDACYLFVKVENGIATIEAPNPTATGATKTKIEDQMKAKGWKELGTGYENIYVYVGAANVDFATKPLKVDAGADINVFEKFKIAGTTSSDTMKSYADKQIVVTAYGVQVDGFENSTSEAIWNAAFNTTPTGGSN